MRGILRTGIVKNGRVFRPRKPQFKGVSFSLSMTITREFSPSSDERAAKESCFFSIKIKLLERKFEKKKKALYYALFRDKISNEFYKRNLYSLEKKFESKKTKYLKYVLLRDIQ
tara:strand:- start:39 stop:380 length:342 start_codon:yes stop_codon:yes gene_type:complete